MKRMSFWWPRWRVRWERAAARSRPTWYGFRRLHRGLPNYLRSVYAAGPPARAEAPGDRPGPPGPNRVVTGHVVRPAASRATFRP